MEVLRIQNLTKSFGKLKVIDGLSFAVEEGSIFGFIGQNGTGKTTTMKMILGLLKADGGEIFVCDERVAFGQTKTNENIGYLPDVPEYYSFLRPREYLKLCGDITGMPDDKIISRSEELLALVGLAGENKRIGSFSRGMKQRLGIAQALLNEPKLLICDEPTSALDPIGRKEILDILYKVKGKTTVIFSTHILSDVERICDQVAVLYKGKLALTGSLSLLKAQHKANILMVEFESEQDAVRFVALPGMEMLSAQTQRTAKTIFFHTDKIAETETAVLETLAKSRILPVRLEVAEPTMENLFMEAIQ